MFRKELEHSIKKKNTNYQRNSISFKALLECWYVVHKNTPLGKSNFFFRHVS